MNINWQTYHEEKWAPRQDPPNVRFWIWINNGWVKLTIQPNETLGYWECHQTDEGWSRTIIDWTYEDGVVVENYSNEAMDCDGRLDHHCTRQCPVDRLRAFIPEPDSPMFYFGLPDWVRTRSGQRDYTAEMMGY